MLKVPTLRLILYLLLQTHIRLCPNTYGARYIFGSWGTHLPSKWRPWGFGSHNAQQDDQAPVSVGRLMQSDFHWRYGPPHVKRFFVYMGPTFVYTGPFCLHRTPKSPEWGGPDP